MTRGPRRSQRVQGNKPPTTGLEKGSKKSQLGNGLQKLKQVQQKPHRGQWTEEDMQKAILCVKSGERSIRSAAKFYSIPSSSLGDWLSGNWLSGKTKTKRLGHATYLTAVEEYELKQWCFKMQEVAFSITLPILKNTVKEIVRQFPRPHPFTNDLPGQKWWDCFKSRHPDIVLRCGEALDVKRSMGLNSISCSRWYEMLHTVITTNSYEPSHVWNADEIGIMASGRNSTMKVIARKGSKNVNFSSIDSREWLTIMVCVSASGIYIPQYYIFKGERLLHDHMALCEPGAVMNVQKNGWIDIEIFRDWVLHFKRNVPGGVNKDNKHLLILDGHKSHVSRGALDLYIEMGIDVLTLPSHTSHHMQPLDVSCFKPFKQYMQEEKVNLTLKNPGWGNGFMLKSSMAEMASRALVKALKPAIIIAGFKATGIFPFDPNAMVKHYGPSLPHMETLLSDCDHLEEENQGIDNCEETKDVDGTVQVLNKLQTSRNEIFTESESQQKCGLKRLLLQQKVQVLGEKLEKEIQLGEAEIKVEDSSDIENGLESKNTRIKSLRYDLGKMDLFNSNSEEDISYAFFQHQKDFITSEDLLDSYISNGIENQDCVKDAQVIDIQEEPPVDS